MRDRADLDPLGARLWGALHVEEVALRAVRVALHDHGPVDHVRQQPRRDVGVVLQQIALGDLQFFPEQLVQVRQAHLALTET